MLKTAQHMSRENREKGERKTECSGGKNDSRKADKTLISKDTKRVRKRKQRGGDKGCVKKGGKSETDGSPESSSTSPPTAQRPQPLRQERAWLRV